AKISHIHGMARRVNGLLVVPFYHPAAALHQPSLRAVLEEDFAKLPELIESIVHVPEYAYEEKNEDQAEQLSMF
ncbi:MAG: uracil-DNA glycosylase, partial [Chloroflexota bacterium]|nr:uracil-DNA glycosylase [Chloroflexota bacterium]